MKRTMVMIALMAIVACRAFPATLIQPYQIAASTTDVEVMTVPGATNLQQVYQWLSDNWHTKAGYIYASNLLEYIRIDAITNYVYFTNIVPTPGSNFSFSIDSNRNGILTYQLYEPPAGVLGTNNLVAILSRSSDALAGDLWDGAYADLGGWIITNTVGAKLNVMGVITNSPLISNGSGFRAMSNANFTVSLDFQYVYGGIISGVGAQIVKLGTNGVTSVVASNYYPSVSWGQWFRMTNTAAAAAGDTFRAQLLTPDGGHTYYSQFGFWHVP